MDKGTGIVRTQSASVSFENTGEIRCLVYIGLPENPQFLGPYVSPTCEILVGHELTQCCCLFRQDPDALARKILESKGPSGENKEYLYNLETALLGLSKESGDAHVSDLVRRCREIEGREGGVRYGDGGMLKVESAEEQEEVER